MTSTNKRAGVIREFEVATSVAARKLAGKAVINISIGGSKSNALNSTIAALTKADVVVVVAAGNENVNVSLPFSLTPFSPFLNLAKASFSNFGAEIDIFAPGVNVQSVRIKSDTASAVLKGVRWKSSK